MRVRLTSKACRDLENICSYFLDENPTAGANILAAIQRCLGLLEAMPLLGRETDMPPTRRLVVPRLPYAIFYQIAGDEIIVLTIFHSSRNPSAR